MTRDTVLVTGATGVIGRAVVPRLRERWHVVTASARPGDGGCDEVVDLVEPGAVGRLLDRVRPDFVVHLVGGLRNDFSALWETNLFSTLGLLDAVRRRMGTKVVVFGSAAEYGAAGDELLSERARLAPVTEYGRAKAVQTLAALRAIEEGLEVRVLRPFNVVSADLPLGTPLGDLRAQLLAQQGRKRLVTCGRLDVERDFVPVDFVAEAVAGCLARWPRAHVLNVCTGIGTRLGDVLQCLARELDVELMLAVDEGLATMAVADRVVGDPVELEKATGLSCRPTCDSLARTVLAG